MNIKFATGNFGKFIWLQNLLDLEGIVVEHLPLDFDNEGNDVYENAIQKALCGSALSDHLVVASDEGLSLKNVSGWEGFQPHIRDMVCEGATDDEVIRFFEEILADVSDPYAVIETVFAAARMGKIIGAVQFEMVCSLRLPPSRFDRGRPISSIHYFPQHKKYYADLTEQERAEIYQPIKNKLLKLININ